MHYEIVLFLLTSRKPSPQRKPRNENIGNKINVLHMFVKTYAYQRLYCLEKSTYMYMYVYTHNPTEGNSIFSTI